VNYAPLGKWSLSLMAGKPTRVALTSMQTWVRREYGMAPRAFVSFEMEDKWSRDFLVEHAHNKRNDIEFVDYSVQNPFDSSWKTNCKERIGRTKGTIVMIGPTTSKSEAVLWEIAETARQDHYLLGIQINKDKTYTIPAGLPSPSVIRWNFEAIVKALATWT